MASGHSDDPYDDDHAVLDDDFLNDGSQTQQLGQRT
jgi:hypothetical protein